jgi:hypothetical protein
VIRLAEHASARQLEPELKLLRTILTSELVERFDPVCNWSRQQIGVSLDIRPKELVGDYLGLCGPSAHFR